MGNRLGLGLGLWPGGGQLRYDQLVASLAPELWLRMDAATDSSGKGRVVANTAVTFTAPGAIANDASAAGKFNGTSSKLSITNWTTGYSTFSVLAWVKLGGATTDNPRILAARGAAGTWFDMLVSAGNLFLVFDGTASTNLSTTTLSQGIWYPLAMVVSAGTVQGYVNGLPEVGGAWHVNTTTNGLMAGTLEVTGADFWPGWLDEIVLTQQALTAEQVEAIAAARKAQVTATVTAVANKARFVFSQPIQMYNGIGDFSAFQVNASGGGLVSPTAKNNINSTTVDFTYASSVVSTNAWQVNDEPPLSAIGFGGGYYLKAPMSGTAA